MNRSPHTSRTDLEHQQLSKLRALVRQLSASNAFYRDRLKTAGLDDACTLAEFCERLPLTTKAEIVADQTAHPPYGTNLTFDLSRYSRFHQTSGTTGTPLRWLDTAEDWSAMLGCWEQVFRAAKVTRDDRVCFTFSFGPFLGFWTAFEAATRLGCLCLPGGGLSTIARLRLLRDNQATVLCCTPTYALRLAEVAQQESFDIADLAVRLIIVAGEPGGSVPATRQLIEQRWSTAADGDGVRVFDHHGMTEVGPVTYECPNRPGTLRIIESSYLAEVIDPKTLDPAEPGERGELVLTTLDRVGSPLLRYRTGDLVQPIYLNDADEPVGGGSGSGGLALEGGILGRADDMVLVRGVNIYPAAVDQVIRSIEGVHEYRVEIDASTALTRMAVILEAEDGVAARVDSALQQAFSMRVPVRTVEANTLPRFEMKARRWVHTHERAT
ncbi:MAG: AMP-binding protein [Phycisphaeraceae bacterium]